MRSARQVSTLEQRRRYPRLLTPGGGQVVTAVVMFAFCSALISAVRMYIFGVQQVFFCGHNRVMSEIDASEATFRNALIRAERSQEEIASIDRELIERFTISGEPFYVTEAVT